MIRWAHPEALLLVPLVLLALRGRCWPRRAVGVLRIAVLAALAALVAGPVWVGTTDGRDVVLVVDRSASMPPAALEHAPEIARELAAAAAAGDRIGVVAFGREPAIVSAPRAPFAWSDLPAVDADGSDLAAAVDQALALVPPGRQGSLLVLSDGLHRGGDLDASARQARRQGLRVDAVLFGAPAGGDSAVVDVLAPASIARGEPFAIGAVVVADREAVATWRLLVDGTQTDTGTAAVAAGRNVLPLRGVLPGAGDHEVAVEVHVPGDARPENDRAVAVVRGDAPARVLAVTPGGRDGRLAAALRGAGLETVVAAPATAPLSPAELAGFRAVVLEDVPAAALPPGAMRALATWVGDLGGGLLMTGGHSSFGVGGYHRSPLEPVLPVSLEIREQQRQFGLAMVIVLDCSGSMGVPAGGETKMQLASRGAASAVELLSAIDDVAVLAVDTAADVVVARQRAADRGALASAAGSITVGGGGIFVGVALHAAAEQLRGAPQRQQHVLLFADASDAEEPGDYATFVPQLARDGVSVSVIGLGAATDPDAPLLRRIAELGGGRCQFVADARDLPRAFAQETIQAARSSLVEAPTPLLVRPGLELLGELPQPVPEAGGYAMAWLRPRAELALSTADAQQAPFLAHWHVGLGRCAAFLGEADGALSGAWAGWNGYGAFFGTLARWLTGGQQPGLYATAWRDGVTGVLELEVEPERAAALDQVRGALVAPDGASSPLAWQHAGPGRLTARVRERPGVWRAAAQVGGDTVRFPPLCLPYSPELQREADARAGEHTLRRLVEATGGVLDPAAAAVLAGERRSAGAFDLGPALAILAVLLLLAEIAVRRLRLFARGPEPVPEARALPVEPAPAPAAPPPTPAEDGVLGALARAAKRTRR